MGMAVHGRTVTRPTSGTLVVSVEHGRVHNPLAGDFDSTACVNVSDILKEPACTQLRYFEDSIEYSPEKSFFYQGNNKHGNQGVESVV